MIIYHYKQFPYQTSQSFELKVIFFQKWFRVPSHMWHQEIHLNITNRCFGFLIFHLFLLKTHSYVFLKVHWHLGTISLKMFYYGAISLWWSIMELECMYSPIFGLKVKILEILAMMFFGQKNKLRIASGICFVILTSYFSTAMIG